MLYVARGQLRVEFAGERWPPRVLGVGELLVLPPGAKCRAYRWPTDSREPAVFLAVAPAPGRPGEMTFIRSVKIDSPMSATAIVQSRSATALRAVAVGGAYSAGVASRLLARPARLSGPASPPRPDDLTTRHTTPPNGGALGRAI